MRGNRWKARPVQSVLLRIFILVVPAAASFAVAALLSTTLPRPGTVAETVRWWGVIGIASLLALFAAERLVRRLGPLSVLLRLSLAFPGEAPSRFRVARRAGRLRELQERLERLRREGRDGRETEVAETILSLAAALSAHDRHTRGHSERVRVFTEMLGRELHVAPKGRDRLRWAALLHDVGKLSVPARILNKDGTLDEREWDVIREHPAEGMRFIAPLVPWLGEWARAIGEHHERFDGTGYPANLSGEQISLGARIVTLADAYDAITAARSYRPPLSAAAAREELARHAGSLFDPRVVRALLNISIGRLWWRVGMWSWLAQLPVLGRVPRALVRSPVLEGSAVTLTRTAVATVAAVGIAGSVPSVAEGGRNVARADVASAPVGGEPSVADGGAEESRDRRNSDDGPAGEGRERTGGGGEDGRIVGGSTAGGTAGGDGPITGGSGGSGGGSSDDGGPSGSGTAAGGSSEVASGGGSSSPPSPSPSPTPGEDDDEDDDDEDDDEASDG